MYIYKQNKLQKSYVYMSKFANLVQMSNCISKLNIVIIYPLYIT